MAIKTSKAQAITSEKNVGFTAHYRGESTPDQILAKVSPAIPKFSKLTDVTITLTWKTSLSSAAKYKLYIDGKQVNETCEAWNKYFTNSQSGLQSYFMSEKEYPGKPVGNVVIDLSATVIRTYYIKLLEVVYTYQIPIFVVKLTKTGEGTVNGAGTFDVGTTTKISAVAADGYKFVKWSDGSTEAERTVTLAEGKQTSFSTTLSYNAIFEKVEEQPKFLSVEMTYGDVQISIQNKVPAGQSFKLAVGLN